MEMTRCDYLVFKWSLHYLFSLVIIIITSLESTRITAQDPSIPSTKFLPPNVPKWFTVPQRIAGYPLYMPQMPIFAAPGSSDYVNGWGDYRWNQFYDQTAIDEPANDVIYNNPPLGITPPSTSLTLPTLFPPMPAPISPVKRDFPNIDALSNMLSTDPKLKAANVTGIIMSLLASLKEDASSNTTQPSKFSQAAAVSQLSPPVLLNTSSQTRGVKDAVISTNSTGFLSLKLNNINSFPVKRDQPFPTSSAVSDEIDSGNNATMPAVMRRKGMCTVGRQRMGICVSNVALQDDCDGMAIKKSAACGPAMSCCVMTLIS